MRDLRHHPLLLFVELTLLFGLGAILFLHTVGPRHPSRAGPRAFATPVMEHAAPPPLWLHDGAVIDVAAEMDRAGASVWRDGAGRALETASQLPSHIFRMNPSDRRAETTRTRGDDFFLEGGLADHARGESNLRLTATLSDDGNHRVYLVDGNLWVHNHQALSVSLAAGDGAASVTFLVLGDIYFLDDFRYGTPDDAVLFVALPRDATSGGSIWLGDVSYGTLARVDGWLYAARDVIGDTLDFPTVVHGGIAAGRYFNVPDASPGGRRLVVQFDDRLAGGRGWVPGL